MKTIILIMIALLLADIASDADKISDEFAIQNAQVRQTCDVLNSIFLDLTDEKGGK